MTLGELIKAIADKAAEDSTVIGDIFSLPITIDGNEHITVVEVTREKIDLTTQEK